MEVEMERDKGMRMRMRIKGQHLDRIGRTSNEV